MPIIHFMWNMWDIVNSKLPNRSKQPTFKIMFHKKGYTMNYIQWLRLVVLHRICLPPPFFLQTAFLGSHQNLREIVILEIWKQVPEILERWKQIPEILENVKTISRNLREIEFVKKWNQVSEIVEKVTIVSKMKL